MDNISLTNLNNTFDTVNIDLNTSKSISNRLLILNYTSDNKINIANLSDADDTVLLKNTLSIIEQNKGKTTTLNLKNAGTTYRFLTALLCNIDGIWILEADERMYQRPIASLVNSMMEIGAEIEYLKETGFPPLKIKGKKNNRNQFKIDVSESSQFVSAIILQAPLFENNIEIELVGKIVSKPYIYLSLELLKKIGFNYTFQNQSIKIYKSEIKPVTIDVEKDWSSASYFYGAFLLSNNIKSLILKGLTLNSIQGDAIIAELFNTFGIVSTENKEGIELTKSEIVDKFEKFDFDFSNYPDISITFAVVCAALNIEANLYGLENLKIKESDRVQSICKELNKFGYNTTYNHYSIQINRQTTPIIETSKLISTYNDHRIAMSMSLLIFQNNELNIENGKVVEKSFPNYWKEVCKLGIKLKKL